MDGSGFRFKPFPHKNGPPVTPSVTAPQVAWMQQSVALQAAPEHSRRWSDPLFILVVELNALHAASSKAESTRAVLPLLHVRGTNCFQSEEARLLDAQQRSKVQHKRVGIEVF